MGEQAAGLFLDNFDHHRLRLGLDQPKGDGGGAAQRVFELDACNVALVPDDAPGNAGRATGHLEQGRTA